MPDSANTLAMVTTMAEMQEAHNEQVHAQWREQGYPYYRAIWVECAELLDHYGWKWWKKQDCDVEQVQLELVDIFHFGLSDLLRERLPLEQIAGSFAALKSKPASAAAFRDAVEQFALKTGQARAFDLDAFIQVLAALPMSFEETFALYVGKNVLNHFRQDHGYQQGSYRKLWQGREDNVHLMELLPQLEGDPKELPEQLYAALEVRYAEP